MGAAHGRKPIHGKPMTNARRQQRRRAKRARAHVALATDDEEKERKRRRLAKAGRQGVPATPEGEARVLAPITKPAASVMPHEPTGAEIEGRIVLPRPARERRARKRAVIRPEEMEAFGLMAGIRHAVGERGWDSWGNERGVRNLPGGPPHARPGTM